MSTTPRILDPKPIVKSEDETKRLQFNFEDDLAVGDTITGTPVFTATPSGQLTIEGELFSGPIAQATFSVGVNGVPYRIKCVINTSAGDVLEMQGDLLVRKS